MIDVLLQIGAAKLVVSAVLAGVAWVVQRRVEHPAVAHLLWLVVLVALLLPAVVAIPVLPGGNGAEAVIAEEATLAGDPAAAGGVVAASNRQPGRGTPLFTHIAENSRAALVVVWLAVAVLLLVWTLVRALRFRHWLARTSLPAPQELCDEVSEIGRSLGLARLPEVHTTTARVSPMVCWTGGMIRVVIPSFLLASLDRQELRAVLAHELAHVRRRDHLVRWIEWLACSAFWWNPVAWWARRELRAAEEASCDALSVTALECSPRDYTESLLRVVELLSRPPTPPTPAFASGAASGRSPEALARRFRVLISGKSTAQTSRWMRATGATAATCLLPLGLVYCGFADQSTPTELEEAPEVTGIELPLMIEDERSGESRPLSWSWRQDKALPVPLVDTLFTYYIAIRKGDSVSINLFDPGRLLDDPRSSGCIWVVERRRGDDRNQPREICADALTVEMAAQEGLELIAVCTGSMIPSGGWRGVCNYPELPVIYLRKPELTAGEVWRIQEYLSRVPMPHEVTQVSLAPIITGLVEDNQLKPAETYQLRRILGD